jgi:hypothetical protein
MCALRFSDRLSGLVIAPYGATASDSSGNRLIASC